jgi:hypothetical protein
MKVKMDSGVYFRRFIKICLVPANILAEAVSIED